MALVEHERTQPEASESPSDLQEILVKQRDAFMREGAPALSHRLSAVDKIHRILIDYKKEWQQAISQDFGNRSHHETLMAAACITIRPTFVEPV